MSPMSDAPLTSVSTRHFELPVVMEDEEDDETKIRDDVDNPGRQEAYCEEASDDVFSPHRSRKTVTFTPEPSCGKVSVAIDVSTQTEPAASEESDQKEWWNISKDVLYQFIPLPPSNCTTPSASHSNLENY